MFEIEEVFGLKIPGRDIEYDMRHFYGKAIVTHQPAPEALYARIARQKPQA